MYNLYDEDEDSSMEERSSENAAMRDKVRNLKAKMRVLNANKKVQFVWKSVLIILVLDQRVTYISSRQCVPVTRCE